VLVITSKISQEISQALPQWAFFQMPIGVNLLILQLTCHHYNYSVSRVPNVVDKNGENSKIFQKKLKNVEIRPENKVFIYDL